MFMTRTNTYATRKHGLSLIAFVYYNYLNTSIKLLIKL